jgi:hypothetical protein
MSPIAIPFDNIAHSQQPHRKKKPIFVHPMEER